MARSDSDRLFIFTASRPEAYQNYINTIEKGFEPDSVVEFLSESDSENLAALVIEHDNVVRLSASPPLRAVRYNPSA